MNLREFVLEKINTIHTEKQQGLNFVSAENSLKLTRNPEIHRKTVVIPDIKSSRIVKSVSGVTLTLSHTFWMSS